MSSVATTSQMRRTRYRRAAAPPIRLTGDDLAIVRHVARHRFLRSTHIMALMPHRSSKKLLERLGALYHNGFLDRPRAQLDYYATAGSAPMVYALGNRGALLLAEQDGMDRGQVDWTWKNRSAGRQFIEHTLLTADLMVAAEGTVSRRADVQLITAQQLLAAAPETTRRAHNPFKMSIGAVVNAKTMQLTVVPDAVFGLDFTLERKRKYFFVEADRATMPIARSDDAQTSYRRKLLTYLAGGGKANAFGTHFGVGNFRVLTVTTGVDRTRSMLAALRNLTGGTGSAQFLFVDRAAFIASTDLLCLVWLSGKGECVTLGD